MFQLIVLPPNRDEENTRIDLLHRIDAFYLQDNIAYGLNFKSFCGGEGDIVVS